MAQEIDELVEEALAMVRADVADTLERYPAHKDGKLWASLVGGWLYSARYLGEGEVEIYLHPEYGPVTVV